MKFKILPFLLLCSTYVGFSQTSTLEYEGKNVNFTLDNIKLVVDTSVGGRITSLKIDNAELLYQKWGSNDNFGSTFWSSPQSLWSWPPPTALNVNPYTIISKDAKSVKMISAKDVKTKFVFSKSFTLSQVDTAIKIVYTIKNSGTTIKQSAPWEVTRYPSGGIVFFPQRKEGESHTGDLATQIEDIRGISWFDYDSTKVPATGTPKYFSDGTEGWLAYVTLSGQLVVKKFSDTDPAYRATSEENEIELYTNPDKSYYEVEQQGKYEAIAIGDSTFWEVKWFVRQVPSTIKIEKGNADLVKYVRDMLERTISGVEKLASSESYYFIGQNTLVIPTSTNHEIQVYNLLGQIVSSKINASGDELHLDLTTLEKGGYIVKSSIYTPFKLVK